MDDLDEFLQRPASVQVIAVSTTVEETAVNFARTVHGELPVPLRHTPGVANTAFSEMLRNPGMLLGSCCERGEVTYLPPRLFCGRSFAELEAGVECAPQATPESFAVGHVGIDGEPLDTPVALDLVKLDRPTTVFLHRLAGVGRPAIGMRVRAVLRDAPTASIDDIEGFEPVQD